MGSGITANWHNIVDQSKVTDLATLPPTLILFDDKGVEHMAHLPEVSQKIEAAMEQNHSTERLPDIAGTTCSVV